MLATLILLCLGVSGAAAWIALRAPRVPALLLVATAGIAPLAAFAFMQTSAHPSRSAFVFDVLGQFHPLSRTVVIGHDSLADLVLPDLDESTGVRLQLSYAADAGQTVLRVERAAVPVFWGGSPINAVRVGRKAVAAAPG